MIDPVMAAANLAGVRSLIEAAGGDDHVEVLAVTKGFGAEIVDVAVAIGCRSIGENYAQEVVAKRGAIEAHTAIEVSFIGQLQSNKIRQLAGIVSVWASVDRAKLVREIARRDPGARIMLQVDTASVSGVAEPGKGGCPIADLDDLVAIVHDAGLDLRGLMTVGPTTGGPESARPGFEAVRAAVDRYGLAVCSMGMTNDLDVAVRCGSTQVRIGTALFGSRPVPLGREQER
ncbi:MAG: alanine racemase [Ilumatobacteraceae bacterium]